MNRTVGKSQLSVPPKKTKMSKFKPILYDKNWFIWIIVKRNWPVTINDVLLYTWKINIYYESECFIYLWLSHQKIF